MPRYVAKATHKTLQGRQSGLLLHLSSLPSQGPIGNLGAAADAFVEFLSQSKQSWWQMLPIHPVGLGYSPYSSISAMAAEPLFINLDQWVEIGWLSKTDLGPLKKINTTKVDYRHAFKVKVPLWRQGYANFCGQASKSWRSAFENFCEQESWWLDDFCLYSALAKRWGSDWSQWAPELKQRQGRALAAARKQFAEDIEFYAFLQFAFDLQWKDLRKKCQKKGIGLIGDIPIFVAHQSADVWAHQESFLLNKDGSPKYVAGVPPDYFNRDGQLWGNALYDWPQMKARGFKWWLQRMQRMFDLFDVARIDHFIGLYRYWQIPAAATSAKAGRWVLADGEALLKKIQKQFGDGRLIAEDLGLVTQEVLALRDRYEIPGMRVLQFAFGTDGSSAYHQPYNYPQNSVVYSGTHDNDTFVGWHKKAIKSQKPVLFDQSKIQTMLGKGSEEALNTAIKLLMGSAAGLTVMPMQDVLQLDSKARMNVPGVAKGNWQWRMPSQQIASSSQKLRLRALTEAFDRC